MPEYDIRLPDGRTVTVRAPDPAAAQAGVRDWWSKQQQAAPGYGSGNVASEAREMAGDAIRGPVILSTPPYPAGDGKTSPATPEQEREWRASGWIPASEDANTADVAAKVGQGFFANWGDEIAATAGALPNIISGGMVGRDRQTILRELRDRERALEEQHPGLATAAELAGAVGSGALTGGIGAGRAAPTIGRTALRSAAIAAPMGAADALGRMEGESDLATKLGTAAAGAGIAGLTGGAVGAAGQTLGRVIAPMASDLAQRLTARGVELTPAEVLGVPMLSRMEDKAAAVVPWIGGQIRDRAAEGVESLNRAAYREVLAPMMGRRVADRVMAGADTGHEAITRLTQVFNRQYRRVVPRLSARPDAALGQEIGRIMQDLPPEAQDRFARGVDKYVNNLVDGNGRITGERLQGAMESLRERAKEYGASLGDPSHRELGRAFGDLRTALLDSAERHSSPRAVASFRRVQAAYRRFRPVRQAAAAVTSPEGRFTPAQLHSAVRAADESAGKGATARGEAVLQDLSSPARAVMTPKAAGSPTAERMMFAGAGGLGGAAGTGAVSPAVLGLLALGIPPALLYSRRGARAFQRFATNPARGPVRAAISNATVRASPGIGMLTERMVEQDAEQRQ